MSQRTFFQPDGTEVLCGYDLPLKYYFLCIYDRDEKKLFSNLDLKPPGMTLEEIKDELDFRYIIYPETLWQDLIQDSVDEETIGESQAPFQYNARPLWSRYTKTEKIPGFIEHRLDHPDKSIIIEPDPMLGLYSTIKVLWPNGNIETLNLTCHRKQEWDYVPHLKRHKPFYKPYLYILKEVEGHLLSFEMSRLTQCLFQWQPGSE